MQLRVRQGWGLRLELGLGVSSTRARAGGLGVANTVRQNPRLTHTTRAALGLQHAQRTVRAAGKEERTPRHRCERDHVRRELGRRAERQRAQVPDIDSPRADSANQQSRVPREGQQTHRLGSAGRQPSLGAFTDREDNDDIRQKSASMIVWRTYSTSVYIVR